MVRIVSCVDARDMPCTVQALSNDAAFVRVRKGVYALRALAGNVGPVPHNTPKSSRPPLGRGFDHRDSYRLVSSVHACVPSPASPTPPASYGSLFNVHFTEARHRQDALLLSSLKFTTDCRMPSISASHDSFLNGCSALSCL